MGLSLERICKCSYFPQITNHSAENMFGLTNKYIEILMSRFGTTFKGVYSSDNIPFFHDYNISLICNLSASSENGTHYVGIYIMKNEILYFDPFGLECVVEDICEYLKRYNKKIVHSNVMIQHPFSFHCGFFCIGVILAIDNRITLLQNCRKG